MFKWDVERIVAVINARAAEGQSLEFKAALPTVNDRGKAEFLKDVSSMANAAGGAILFGINEKSGAAESLSALQMIDADAEIRRLSQILESGVEPRIAGVQFSFFKLGESDVLVVDIPQSLDAPHRFLFNGHSKFVQRLGSHVSEFSYDQLRSAFDQSNSRMNSLRQHWHEDFDPKSYWRPFDSGPMCVIRVSSMLAADGRQVIDPQAAEAIWTEMILPGWGGGSPAFNYEGLVIFPGGSNKLRAMCQVHRQGAVTYRSVVGQDWQDEKIFVPGRAEQIMMEALAKSFSLLRQMGIGGSAVIHAGLSKLGGYRMAFSNEGFDERADCAQIEIQLPEILVSNIDENHSFSDLMRPGFDLIWQTYGQASCSHYRDGTWKVD